MPKALITVLLLIGSNCFMTWAWYGHLKKSGWAIPVAILISWLIAFPEYLLQVPANRIGHFSHGGPFTAAQLKIIQEAITLCVFIVFSVLVLKEKPRWNEGVAMVLIFAGVVVAMLGRAPIIKDPQPDAPAERLPDEPEA
ncbi:MAG: DMT family protein [Phycisphaerales bacterium]